MRNSSQSGSSATFPVRVIVIEQMSELPGHGHIQLESAPLHQLHHVSGKDALADGRCPSCGFAIQTLSLDSSRAVRTRRSKANVDDGNLRAGQFFLIECRLGEGFRFDGW